METELPLHGHKPGSLLVLKELLMPEFSLLIAANFAVGDTDRLITIAQLQCFVDYVMSLPKYRDYDADGIISASLLACETEDIRVLAQARL